MGLTENRFTQEAREYLVCLGYAVTRHQSGTVRLGNRTIHMGDPGWPDLIGFSPDGRFIGVEAKSPDGELNENQKRVREIFRACHAVYIVARTIEELRQGLEAEKLRTDI